jgi:hypothetical protein
VLVIVSLATAAPDAARVTPLTVRGHAAGPTADGLRGADLALSATLVGLVVAAWVYFS